MSLGPSLTQIRAKLADAPAQAVAKKRAERGSVLIADLGRDRILRVSKEESRGLLRDLSHRIFIIRQ
jgi:hypothetical protein